MRFAVKDAWPGKNFWLAFEVKSVAARKYVCHAAGSG